MTDALQILREMVAIDPAWSLASSLGGCPHCENFDGGGHDPDCPWLRGKKLIEKIDKATARRPLD